MQLHVLLPHGRRSRWQADERVRGFVASAVAASVLAEEAPAEGLAAENPEPNVEDDEQRPIEFFDGGVQIEEVREAVVV